MQQRFIGDVHGKWSQYYSLITKQTSPHRSVQVGDMGIGFNPPDQHQHFNGMVRSMNCIHRFIRGNHDDPERCKMMDGWIEDGTVENDIMYVGGAWSIDWAYRTEGVDWWRDEELSVERLNQIYDDYVKTKPRIMVTHDCPTSAAREMFIKSGQALGGFQQIKTRTGEALQAMFEAHQPEYWVFGHWHISKLHQLQTTTFVCLGELCYIDLEI